MIYMKKEQIPTIIIASIIALLVGFYGGRYYERKAMKARIEQRQATISDGTTEKKPPSGMMPGMGKGMR
jgi:hypothetical protein